MKKNSSENFDIRSTKNDNNRIMPSTEEAIPEPSAIRLTDQTAGKVRVLFLGYNRDETRLIDELVSEGCELWHSDKVITNTRYFDIAISFGYRHIISKKVLENSDCPVLNLHLSYLPFNRGAHPNFWSFYDQTPSGVTIHEVDGGIDTGSIVCQKKINFDRGEKTFFDTYWRLREEIECLFLGWKEVIIKKQYEAFQQAKSGGTYHRTTDLPIDFCGWDSLINSEIDRLHRIRDNSLN